MTAEKICELLKTELSEAVERIVLAGGHPHVRVRPDDLPKVALFLRDDSRLQFNLLRSITALDLPVDNELACVYDLMHVPMDHPAELIENTCEIGVRVVVHRRDPVIPSVAPVWPAAEWHEREAFDLMGICFANHPDLRRILCPDDWVGYPLRKDYEFPLEYHGIPATTEYELTNPRH